MSRANRWAWWVVLPLSVLLLVASFGCASLSNLLGVSEPTFAMAAGRSSELRVAPPSLEHPRGVATLRLWTRVTNPNGFGLTLSTLKGVLNLERKDLADVDLPLGLPLKAAADTIVPLDVSFDFQSFSQLGDVARRVLSSGTVAYALNGTVGVDAGPLGEPTFGPRTWLQGRVDVVGALTAGAERQRR